MLADIICYLKMTSYMALDGIIPFLCLKDITNTCKLMQHTKYWREFFSAMALKLEEAEDLKCVLVVYCVLNRNRSALACELLSNNSMFVDQLCEDKSLALRACDLIFFTTDLQTVNYYSSIHC